MDRGGAEDAEMGEAAEEGVAAAEAAETPQADQPSPCRGECEGQQREQQDSS